MNYLTIEVHCLQKPGSLPAWANSSAARRSRRPRDDAGPSQRQLSPARTQRQPASGRRQEEQAFQNLPAPGRPALRNATPGDPAANPTARVGLPSPCHQPQAKARRSPAQRRSKGYPPTEFASVNTDRTQTHRRPRRRRSTSLSNSGSRMLPVVRCSACRRRLP